MVLKDFLLKSSYILLLIALNSNRYANGDHGSNKTFSPFDFIKNLEGSQKGDKKIGTNHLKSYLNKFGYFDIEKDIHSDDANEFDDSLETAIKTYQINHHIDPTGVLDTETVSRMISPRCGNPDIVGGTNLMQSRSKMHVSSSSHIHTVSHYNFFNGMPRWNKNHLSYTFTWNTPQTARDAVSRAFAQWASVSHFTFSETKEESGADVIVRFSRGAQEGFDGPHGTLAQANGPGPGASYLKFDEDEWWVIGEVPNETDLETVATHEVGHILGLDHSGDKDSLMWPIVLDGEIKAIRDDDIRGLKALYGF